MRRNPYEEADRTPLVLLLAGVLALVACGDDSTSNSSGDTSTAQFNDADVQFAQGMIPHHQQAVQIMGDGSHMDTGGMPGTMSADDMHQLDHAHGADWDQMFLTMMIRHHEGAIEMAKSEQTDGQNPDAVAVRLGPPPFFAGADLRSSG